MIMKEYDQDPNNSSNIMLVYTGSAPKSTSFNKEQSDAIKAYKEDSTGNKVYGKVSKTIKVTIEK